MAGQATRQTVAMGFSSPLQPGSGTSSRWAIAISLAVLLAMPLWWTVSRSEPNVGSPPWAGSDPHIRSSLPPVLMEGVAGSNLGVHSLRLADLERARADPPPLGLAIPAVGVRASIVPVGVEPAGAMEIPEDMATVGWYRFGPSPGRPGSAVLVGHFDSRVYGPGVFSQLSEIDPGDVVRVHVTKGRWESFEVVSRNLVLKERLPQAIFASEGDPVLTLITCGGSFQQAARQYTHNVVISAVPLD